MPNGFKPKIRESKLRSGVNLVGALKRKGLKQGLGLSGTNKFCTTVNGSVGLPAVLKNWPSLFVSVYIPNNTP
jgi:hypothetical protein